MPRGATPGRNLGKEVATGYAAHPCSPGWAVVTVATSSATPSGSGSTRWPSTSTEVAQHGPRVPAVTAGGKPPGNRWLTDLGDEDLDCRISAARGPLSTRSPVVGKTDIPATGSAGRGWSPRQCSPRCALRTRPARSRRPAHRWTALRRPGRRAARRACLPARGQCGGGDVAHTVSRTSRPIKARCVGCSCTRPELPTGGPSGAGSVGDARVEERPQGTSTRDAA
jgi:hypothetical protein